MLSVLRSLPLRSPLLRQVLCARCQAFSTSTRRHANGPKAVHPLEHRPVGTRGQAVSDHAKEDETKRTGIPNEPRPGDTGESRCIAHRLDLIADLQVTPPCPPPRPISALSIVNPCRYCFSHTGGQIRSPAILPRQTDHHPHRRCARSRLDHRPRPPRGRSQRRRPRSPTDPDRARMVRRAVPRKLNGRAIDIRPTRRDRPRRCPYDLQALVRRRAGRRSCSGTLYCGWDHHDEGCHRDE